MRKQIILCMLALLTVSGVTFAQSKKKKKKKEDTDQQMPNSLGSNLPEKDYTPKKSKRRSVGPNYESDVEYKKRMEATVKQKIKNERLMETPQYTDPSYFGHKRPPKRHKPSKMKFCKVCGIRH